MRIETMLRQENAALRKFVTNLGFDATKVITELSKDEDAACKTIALSALRVGRDFSETGFSQAGIDAANTWLNSLT